MENNHSSKLFWFCVFCVAIGLTFLIALCFFPVAKGSERFADNVQGFIEGSIVTAAISYLLGSNLPTNKKTVDTMKVDTDNVDVKEK